MKAAVLYEVKTPLKIANYCQMQITKEMESHNATGNQTLQII